MNKIISLYLLLFVLANHPLEAQEPSLPSPPEASYPGNAPVSATWTITYKPKRSSPPSTPESTDKPVRAPGLKEIIVTKVGTIRQDIFVWSDGVQTEQWVWQGLILSEQAGSPDVFIRRIDQLSDFLSGNAMDYAKSDFPELKWVSAATYVDIARYENHQCYHYQMQAQPEASLSLSSLQEPSGKITGTQTSSTGESHPVPQAWIDSLTKLPVALDDGYALQIYSFKEIVARELTLPPRFEKALQIWQKATVEPKKYKMVY